MSLQAIVFVFLFFAVPLLGYYNYDIWSHPGAGVPKMKAPPKTESKSEPSAPAAVPSKDKDPAVRETFAVIGEKNIFNPDRKEFSVTQVAGQAKPMVRPQVILYGITIVGDYEAASVVNPGRTLRKGEREMMTLKVGDKVGDYKLAKVSPDRITLEAEGDSYEVLLFDPKAPKKRSEVKTLARPIPTPGVSPVPGTGVSPVPRIPVPTMTPPSVSSTVPSPSVTPPPVSSQPYPRPVEPSGERMTGTPPLTGSTPGGPIPDTGIWRGRRPMRISPPGSEGN
jgi:hypothetical protein